MVRPSWRHEGYENPPFCILNHFHASVLLGHSSGSHLHCFFLFYLGFRNHSHQNFRLSANSRIFFRRSIVSLALKQTVYRGTWKFRKVVGERISSEEPYEKNPQYPPFREERLETLYLLVELVMAEFEKLSFILYLVLKKADTRVGRSAFELFHLLSRHGRHDRFQPYPDGIFHIPTSRLRKRLGDLMIYLIFNRFLRKSKRSKKSSKRVMHHPIG